MGGDDVDVVDADAEIGDQSELRSRRGDDIRVEAVGDGGREDIGALHGGTKGGGVHRRIIEIEFGVEEFAHPRLHRVGKFAGDDDFWLAGGHELESETSEPGRRIGAARLTERLLPAKQAGCFPGALTEGGEMTAKAAMMAGVALALAGCGDRGGEDRACPPSGRSMLSGFCVPRWVSLKRGEVYGRKGPGKDYPALWIYRVQGLPVQVVAETTDWRRRSGRRCGASRWFRRRPARGGPEPDRSIATDSPC